MTRMFKLPLSSTFFSCRKRNEGSDYDDDTLPGDKIDNAIHPGQIYTYKWQVPERAGPGPNGPTCVTWAYYFDVNPIKDRNSGLVGPLVVCKKVSSAIGLRTVLCLPQKRDEKGGSWGELKGYANLGERAKFWSNPSLCRYFMFYC